MLCFTLAMLSRAHTHTASPASARNYNKINFNPLLSILSNYARASIANDERKKEKIIAHGQLI